MNKIITWWATPKLPRQYIFLSPENPSKGIFNTIDVYFKQWVIHPIKRRIAKYYLILLKRFVDITVIGITGSAGKTTTKEMIAAILRQKGQTVYSFANIDPVYNIPTTILSARPSTKYLILEMGVEYPGEMDFYLWLAKPDVGIITNIYPTHTEFLGSIEGVAKEKGKLIRALGRNHFAVLNYKNDFCRKIGERSKAPVFWFNDDKIKAGNAIFTKNLNTQFVLKIGLSKISILLPVLGNQFVQNALAAATVGYIFGASSKQIKKGLEHFNIQEHRMRPIRLKSGATILDDSYNNNPEAAREAFKTFEEVSNDKEKIIVFGDMLELGDLEKKSHKEIGEAIARLNPQHLICVGNASKITAKAAEKKLGRNRVEWVPDADSVPPRLIDMLKKNVMILIKGSRSIGLDKVVNSLQIS